jgi:predicted RNase H-like HicB family nuclease
MKKSYTVQFTRDVEPGWWVVRVPEVQGCLTQARSIAEGRRRIREALALFIDEAEAEREMAEKMREKAQDATRAVVNQLTRRAGLSVRDAAEMLGISYQRVQQLAGGR